MTKLLEGVNTPMPIIDQRLKDKLFVCANAVIDKKICNLFSQAVFAVSEQLEHDEILNKLPYRVNCAFTNYGKVTIEMSNIQLGSVMGLIIYPMQKWIDRKLTDLQILTCITEELCHYFWSIEDEVEVNYKVLEVIKRMFPGVELELHHLYNVNLTEKEPENN